MGLGLLSSFVERRKRRRLRTIVRGYLCLRRAGRLERIAVVKDALTVTVLQAHPDRVAGFFYGAGAAAAEQSTRQQLLMRLGALNFNEALLWSVGSGLPLSYPLPKQWREILRQHQFKVAGARSALAWSAFVMIMLFNGALVSAKHVLLGLKHTLSGGRPATPPYVYFDGLSAGNLPQPMPDDQTSHDIVTWYMSWPERNHAAQRLGHSVAAALPAQAGGVPVIYAGAAVPPLAGIGVVLGYSGWALGAFALATLGLLRGRWQRALMLGEAATARAVHLQCAERLALDYLFHNSSWANRRLWTYEAELKGARILFYFYSTNCEGFKRADGYPPPMYGYRAMNWSRYLVWDEAHADFVRRVAGNDACSSVVGPIWFNAGPAALPEAEHLPVIAVFDVAPTRFSYYVTLGLDTEYYVPRTNLGFLRDIHRVAAGNGYRLYWKRKRKMAANTAGAYRRFAEQFSKLEAVRIVDPDISAQRVIERSALVVSMPFTSTALIARQLGKPSCYYDPDGQLQPDDRAAHGIPIVQGAQALAAWVRQHAVAPSRFSSTTH